MHKPIKCFHHNNSENFISMEFHRQSPLRMIKSIDSDDLISKNSLVAQYFQPSDLSIPKKAQRAYMKIQTIHTHKKTTATTNATNDLFLFIRWRKNYTKYTRRERQSDSRYIFIGPFAMSIFLKLTRFELFIKIDSLLPMQHRFQQTQTHLYKRRRFVSNSSWLILWIS